MKVTDLNQVQAMVITQVEQQEWDLLDYVSEEIAVQLIVNIYMMNDQTSGYGQDMNNGFSVISSRQRIAVIYEGHHSSFKHAQPLCMYEDLYADIETILIVMQAAIERMQCYMV